MEMKIYFPGGKKVYADYNGFTIETDQAVRDGGEGCAPAPFDLFLSSIGTCAGIYVLGFCQQRGLSTEGIEIKQTLEFNPTTRMISKINLDIQVPSDFPEKYHDALIRSAELCAVKKHMEDEPEFAVKTVVNETISS